MRILVDATVLAAPAYGLPSYVRGLVPHLAGLPDVEVTAVVPPGERLGAVPAIEAPESVARLPLRAAWRERNLARIAAETRADVLLSPSPEIPLRGAGVPSIMVVHDVFPLSAPALVGRAKRLRFAAVLPRMCARASAIVCVSRATALALHRTVGTPLEAIAVIGEGPSPLAPDAPAVSGPRPYVLAVGALYRRKQIDVLIRALAPAAGLDLVLAGPADDEGRAGVLAAAQRLGVGARVRHEGWVTPERLGGLYRGAAVLALPSLEEGFGRSMLDALAAGVPVVASDIPALRELGGDAARFVADPADATQWADALAAVAGDEPLRRRMADAGREVAAERTWPRVAEAFGALARRLAA